MKIQLLVVFDLIFIITVNMLCGLLLLL